MKQEKKWYAIYTKPRWEKKVYQLLSEKSIEAYCPLNKVRRQWSDRVKVVMEPLFKSYVFVWVSEADMTQVRMVNGVLNFVYWAGKPAIVKAKEIEQIKKFLNEYENVTVEKIAILPHQKVRITRGIFMEKEGEVLKVVNNKAIVSIVIDSLGYRLTAQVNKNHLEVLPQRNGIAKKKQ